MILGTRRVNCRAICQNKSDMPCTLVEKDKKVYLPSCRGVEGSKRHLGRHVGTWWGHLKQTVHVIHLKKKNLENEVKRYMTANGKFIHS